MNSFGRKLRGFWKRLRGEHAQETVSPDFSYRIFWTKQALEWSQREREQIHREVRMILDREDFEANAYRRRYTLEGFGGGDHAGASLLVLHSVLEDLERMERSGGVEP